ncbi:C-type lectin domain family 12 member B-like [Tupaia chinensis]|uniref:C-type lectin domain family 12 member B-like n=1 Tax=Tupaia chinensis TaxID=246437 RepID=UPI000FFB0BE9|nr:C-type lectin domain family 12 member B-like [Tupaia chinensis]
MSNEVTYATLKFPNTSKTNNLQENYSLKRTDNVPETEMDSGAEIEQGGVESRVEEAESRAVRDYQELFLCNRTAFEIQQNRMEQLERNWTLFMAKFKNVSSEHSIFKIVSENTLIELNNYTSNYCEDLKEKKDVFAFNLCSDSWIWHQNSCYYFSTEQKFFEKNTSDCRKQYCSLMKMDNEQNWTLTQLFFSGLPSPHLWVGLNCTLNKRNQTTENVSNFCSLACLAPP